MKKRIITVFLGILAVLFACSSIQSANEVPRISKDGLRAKLGSPGMLLLDVRTESDWKMSDSKITGAMRMDPDAVDTWAATLPSDKEIILYCA